LIPLCYWIPFSKFCLLSKTQLLINKWEQLTSLLTKIVFDSRRWKERIILTDLVCVWNCTTGNF
jgi:hypothetical protein